MVRSESCGSTPFSSSDPEGNNVGDGESPSLQSEQDSYENPSEVYVGSSEKEITKACVEMVIIDELPFSFVEKKGFREFMLCICPEWKIPCHQTIATEVLNMYYVKRQSLKELIKSYRVSITTDTWTSLQNINYMVVTAHFIDCDWVLHKKIINFCVIPNHKGDSIGRLLEECLCEWGIEKLLTVTVNNASSYDSGLSRLIKGMVDWKSPFSLLHDGMNLHVKCIAHILNLIVNDGLAELNSSIQSIRDAVRYVRSSSSSLAMFKKCVEMVKLSCKGLVILDVPTRWNSTYLMLESALKFRRAFERLVDDDPSYQLYFTDDKRNGPPAAYDWDVVDAFVVFLKPFYDITLKVCCSKTPTVQSAFMDMFKIYDLLCHQKSVLLPTIVNSMRTKYCKYWGQMEHVNPYYFIALILDPRHKLETLVDYFEVIFCENNMKVEEAKNQVKLLFTSLYNIYEEDDRQRKGNDNDGGSFYSMSNESVGLTDLEMLIEKKRKKRRTMKSKIICNDVDRYLSDSIEEVDDSKFDILVWWKVSGLPRYPILSLIAQEVLAIPVSTIASESCFSTSGRIINSFRSSLSPKMVEALICTQNWLSNTYVALQFEPTIEEMESYETIEEEMYVASKVQALDISNSSMMLKSSK